MKALTIIGKKSGKEIRFEAEYSEHIEARFFDADGDKIEKGTEVIRESKLVVYIDGEVFDTCTNDAGWRMIDVQANGLKKVWGIKSLCFDDEQAAEIEEFLQSVIEEGRLQETKDAAEKEKKEYEAKRLEAAKNIVKMAEAQKDIPDKAEAKRRMEAWNEVLNEGGSGYVPHIVTKEAYEWAKAFIAEQEG